MSNEDPVENLNKFFKSAPKDSTEFLDAYKAEIIPESEKIFVRDFLFPILGNEKMSFVVPQYPFIDSEGHSRRIDFGIVTEEAKVAFEINGEVYHGEGIIPSSQFDDNLFRQNEILFHGWVLRRYSYNQLVSPEWRPRIFSEIKRTLKLYAPSLVKKDEIKPNAIQKEVLPLLKSKREIGWDKGLCIMPVGTGKTYTAALDSYDYFLEEEGEAKVLFIVHKLGILDQAYEAFQDIWKDCVFGKLTGEEKENIDTCDILFASKDSLCVDTTLRHFDPAYFDYIIIDEVHHGEAPTYRKIIDYFTPKFLLGMTATPDRTDRKSILDLFDYKIVCEIDLNYAIEKGFLVAYEYHGLTDNIDYSKIRYNGKKYNINDLEKALIIEKRNAAIFDSYMKYCHGDKAIGFCVSIRHAKAMADFFNGKGVKSIAITSDPEEDQTAHSLIEQFRNNEYSVAFTVDMFNEGIDVPNVQALLFLRPTESKTIFVQQLGRGLRLSSNKDRVVVLDFISNYKRANQVRQYLAESSTEKKNPDTNAYEKTVYKYNPRCQVLFDDQVQQILDLQDQERHVVNEDDLVANYFDVKTEINRKPTPNDINSKGKYKTRDYINVYGSWLAFLKQVGEITENGYHYPQGLDFGHILYILKTIAEGQTETSNIASQYVRLRGSLDENKDIATFQRQTKYKLQGMMGMGLIVDDRKSLQPLAKLELTENGMDLYKILKPLISGLDFSFKEKAKGISWEMTQDSKYYVKAIYSYLASHQKLQPKYLKILLQFDAFRQMLDFVYKDCKTLTIEKRAFYQAFFDTAEVSHYCEYNGIEIPTSVAREHRAPFLVSTLETIGLVSTSTSTITIQKMILTKSLFESTGFNADQIEACEEAIVNRNTTNLDEIEIEKCKEMFGPDVFSYNYRIGNIEKTEE